MSNFFPTFSTTPTGRSPWSYGYETPRRNAGPMTDPDIYRVNTMYSTDNPARAVDNILRDVGYNPYAANPYLQSLRSAAPAMNYAYQASRALDPNQRQANTGDDFRDFLGNAFGFGPGGQFRPEAGDFGFYANINRGHQALPELITRIRGLDPGATGAATDMNPYLWSLHQQFGTDQGKGVLDYMAAMQAPLMGQRMRQSYGTLLNAAYEGGLRRYALNTGGLGQGDLYTYLLGI